MPTSAVLVHLCGLQEWERARSAGGIVPGASGSCEFIHLSTPQQVHLPANRLYRGRDDLVLLYVDADALGAPVRWERGVPTDPASMLFPHLYGLLPADAVVRAVAYAPGPDGDFPPIVESTEHT